MIGVISGRAAVLQLLPYRIIIPLYKSAITLEYLEEAYPVHTAHFLPQDSYEERLLQFQDSQDTGSGGVDTVRQEFLGHLKELVSGC